MNPPPKSFPAKTIANASGTPFGVGELWRPWLMLSATQRDRHVAQFPLALY